MTPKSSSSREPGEAAGRAPGIVEPPPGAASRKEAWPLGFQETAFDGERRSLTMEMGAALERDLLLAGATEDPPASRPPGASRALLRLIAGVILLAVLGSGIFFFVESRRTWEGKVLVLENELAQTREDSATREKTLLGEGATKDEEIAEWKAKVEGVTSLADRTLEQLKVSLDDFRSLREEKLQIEAENRKLLQQQKSPIGYFFTNWLPLWLRESSLDSAGK